MIRALIFDCFGVLYHGSFDHLRQLLPPERQQELMDLNMSSDYGYISRDEYLERAAALIGMSAGDLQRITHQQHIRNEPLMAYLRDMKRQYKIGLLSNVGSSVMDRLFTPDELSELFDTVVLSSDIGMTKPHPEIFQLTADRLGVPAEECIMIDDLLANIDGAQQAGMKGVVYSTVEQATRTVDEYIQGKR